MKKCTKCGIEKEFTEFYKRASSKTGYESQCKKCVTEYGNLWRERMKSRDMICDESAVTKACSSCGAEKNISDFSKRTCSKSGYDSQCKVCVSKYIKDIWYPENKQSVIDRSAVWAKNNPDKAHAGHVMYRIANRDKTRAAVARWAKANPDKVTLKHQLWASNNPDRVAEKDAKRRARKLNATPLWGDAEKIRAIYLECKVLNSASDIRYEVDHIVPLQSSTVSGLHWEGNLRIVTRSENRIKSNRYWPDMP